VDYREDPSGRCRNCDELASLVKLQKTEIARLRADLEDTREQLTAAAVALGLRSRGL
jgi:hypothetical protein